MHGFSSASALLVNAEVDSMGGVVESRVGVGNKTSRRCVVIEKVQAELRQEYDVREERRRELEFLEKGGNPLDFKIGNAASVSVQSTSLTDHNPDQFVTSEAKGSFAITASPHGDSVESSGRPGAPLSCEPISADNLMLFYGENEFSEGDRNSLHPHRTSIAPSGHSLRLDGSQNPNELGDSATFGVPRKAYKRRYSSKPSRNGARSGSNDVFLAHGGHGSLPLRHGPRDVKVTISCAENQEDLDISLKCNSKPTSPKGGALIHKTSVSEGQQGMVLDGARAVESSEDLIKSGSPNVNSSKFLLDGQLGQQSLSVADEAPNEMAIDGLVTFEAREEAISTGIEYQPTLAAVEVEKQSNNCPVNGAKNDNQYKSSACGTKGLHSESSCIHPSQTIDGNNDSEMHTNAEDNDSNGNNRYQTIVPDGSPSIEGDELVKQNKETNADDLCTSVNEECSQSHQENGLALKADEELNGCASALQNEAKDQVIIHGMEAGVPSGPESERQPNISMCDSLCNVKRMVSLESSNSELSEGAVLARVFTVTPEEQTSSGPDLKLTSKAAENSILEEAQVIEAKRKRILELSTATIPLEKCRKSQWAYVLEEMAWLANDFAQERLWKQTVAAQICHRVAFTSQLKKQEESLCMKVKQVAHSLAKAVMKFWHSVEDSSKELEQQCPEKDVELGIHSYAVRFLKYNNTDVLCSEAEEPVTPDRISNMGFLDISRKDHLIEENLFYTVAPGALETYRRSIESRVIQCEKTGSSMQEEVETSTCDAVADFESQANAYEEDEGETIKYDMAVAFDDSKSSRFVPTKRKHLTNAYVSRSYEAGPDSSHMQCMENKAVLQQSTLAGKQPSSSLNVSFPTKRVRTASRRVFSPFSAGTSGCIQLPNKTDASSGDTNSFQDDQSTLHGGSLVPNSLEVESLGELEKQLPFDCADVSTRPKKKKKAKHLNTAFEQRWQMNSNFHNDQREHSRKRSESYQLESNGSNGLFGQHIMKKSKIMQQLLDNSSDNIAPTGGSVPSPVASQMSNMPNPNKFIKILGGRDQSRKAKMLKMPAGHMGSGSPWSLLEDQALIVLVHDMGPNWELVSDALNSSLQFKCIFRKPNECKEHHKILTDRTSGDGADSAEDSGSSQPYPSTLPGIPKGSARQLFQRLQGPVEEDTLKFHFEKIITIGQKQNYRKTQDSIKLPDCSHADALSQVSPNNLNGGTILTPLDLCDITTSSSDLISLGYQGAHSSGLTIPNQGSMAQMLPPSGATCAVQGSSNLVIGNNFLSPVPHSTSVRDGRYGVARSASLSIDEQQRLQQYNQMISGRNIQQPIMSTPGTLSGTDRGVRMLPGGNGIGMVGGTTRTMPMTRPGFQGVPASSMVNSGSMVSLGMVSMPSAVNMHSGVGSGQGNSMLRPRESLHMMRPGNIQDSQRQIMVPDVQMQVSPGNSQGLSPFGGLTSSFPNQTATSPVSSYPLQHQQSHPMSPQQSQVLSPHHPHVQGANHAPSPQQQAFAIRLAKERQMQHQFLQEQRQRQFAASNTLMSHGKPQSQLPISSPMRNSAQIQTQTSSPASLAPSTSASSLNSMLQHQQKHQLPSPGMVRNAQTGGSGLTNQMGKQRPRQQLQQFSPANRQHPQQRQQSESQQQTKHVRGVGRGNLMHQNIQIDPSLSNGLSKNLGNQSAEKVEATHLMQDQGLYSGSAVNAGQSARKLTPSQSSNQSLHQPKIYSSQAPSSSKHKQQITTHSDSSHVQAVSPGPDLSSGHQAASNHHRVMQQNHQLNSNLPNKPQTRDSEFDQHPAGISSVIGARTTLPQSCNIATNVEVFHASAPRWNASEHSFDPSNLATNLGSVGSTAANASEPASLTCQGSGQRQSPANLLSAQQQQHTSQLQPPSLPVVPKPQSQVPQSGNGSSCGRPGDPRLE
ncbi:chromatin modification-related EAF1 B-like isoform X1 [Olea europaea subsp. europaea]|uniref:Chromatin modification-related EAF1 B-like isoform X1 n=1 Tax=Olea europaea subsp. europaea TaxID=158383 RepID=A0A8S0V6U8_OLEEU|nr:chromatin modification-related EAF1 B-like isoform X1 [Olea europaea subsp. europaea]